jgi:hypothetical protein
MHVVTRLRLLLVRRPWIWWVAVAAAAAVVGIGVAGALRRLDGERRSWGEARTVWVAAGAVAPGDPLVVEARSYPVAVVPRDAVTQAPNGAVARQRVAAGEVVVVADVSVTGPPGLVPAGWVAVPVAQRATVARVGDAVAAFADGQRLADGVVIAVDEEQVVVAVAPEVAADVSRAVPGGAVVIGLVGPPDPT